MGTDEICISSGNPLWGYFTFILFFVSDSHSPISLNLQTIHKSVVVGGGCERWRTSRPLTTSSSMEVCSCR